MRRLLTRMLGALTGSAVTCVVMLMTFEDTVNAVIAIGLLLGGPAWCWAIAAASDDSDFAGAGTSRTKWLDVLPWTFLLAPLVLPNMFILAGFVRDARADSGRSALTWDRMRPGESARDHHWPD